MPDPGPSTIPSPSPPLATASLPSSPITAQAPIPSQANIPPDPSTVLVEPPLAQPSPPEVQVDPSLVQPAASQQPQRVEAGPSQHPSPATSPPEPSPVPPSAPSGSAAGPSSSVAGPSQSPPPVPLYYHVSPMSQACAESLIVNQSFHAVHCQHKMLQDKVTELELQLNNPTQASYALRAEIKALTRKNSLEQALEHQRAMDQLAQKLCAGETLA
ncbi:classical arabinogalactan protein 9-like [Zingiber officinale]|uniref:classical arabinogalactan protein 9-like n=1 Tax=Zingiber officinale TaxID=94328 RepID=UPI001C4AB7DC|nr:classical arabinogalactan protein 9-like [Zingiber officinale]